LHVIRCFEDENVMHVNGSIDPVRDAETINFELIFSDLELIERRIERVEKAARADKKLLPELEILKNLRDILESETSLRTCELSEDEQKIVDMLELLSAKPMIYCANVGEDEYAAGGGEYGDAIRKMAEKESTGAFIICAELEYQLSELDPEEREEYLLELGVSGSGLPALVNECYSTLGLVSFLTAGPKETRAWTIRKGTKAPKAAGKIHSDLERGFIRAEVVSYDDLVRLGSMNAAKEAGLVRSEGKEYVMRESDVVLFRFNV